MSRWRSDRLGGTNPGAGYCSLEMSKPWNCAGGSWRDKSSSQRLPDRIQLALQKANIRQGKPHPVPVPTSAMKTFESGSFMEGWRVYPILSFQM